MNLAMRAVVAVLALGIASCGSDAADQQPPPAGDGGMVVDYAGGNVLGCVDSFAGNNSTVNAFCTLCDSSPTHSSDAIDGNPGTYAEYGLPGPSQAPPASEISVRATAPAGVTFPAGSRVGAIMQLGQNPSGSSVTILTYMGGMLQDSFGPYNEATGTGAEAQRMYSYPATRAYDSVEVRYGYAGLSDAPDNALRIYEFCSS